MRSPPLSALLLLSALAFSTSALAGGAPTAQAMAPVKGERLLVEQPFFDGGVVQQGDKVKHTFIVKNAGEGTLTIKRAKGS